MRYMSVAAVEPRPAHQRRWLAICSASHSVFQHDAQITQRRRLPFALNAANYFHSLVHTIATSPRGGAFAMHLSDREQAIVWIHQDSASAIVAITGFVAVFVVAMALAMV